MPQIDQKDGYLTTFEHFQKSLNGQSVSPVHAVRKKAIDRFSDLDFPTTRDEAWRFTNVAPITHTAFKPVDGYDPAGLTPDRIAPFLFEDKEAPCTRLVFVNGLYAPEFSVHPDLPKGVRACSLAEAINADPERIAEHLARHASYQEHAFTALNTAFLRDGAFVSVPRGVTVETPIHLLFLSVPGREPTVSHPRVLLLLEENAQATVVETYAGLGDAVYFTNAVTEVVAADNARLDHYKLERETLKAYHIGTMQIRQGRSSNVSSHAISLGGGLVRNEVSALLAGEGCEATVNGFYLLGGAQHVDNHTLIEHAEPNCASHELYKGILDGASRGVFRGRIYVHQKAQKTDAYQANRNLLLSSSADVATKPQLEIYADDVKCSHGATIGQIDRDAIFYLRARGIGEETARQILIEAFAGDILDRVRIEPLRERLRQIVSEKFETARQTRETP